MQERFGNKPLIRDLAIDVAIIGAIEGEVQDGGIALMAHENKEKLTTVILCNVVINSAGLFSQDVARGINGLS